MMPGKWADWVCATSERPAMGGELVAGACGASGTGTSCAEGVDTAGGIAVARLAVPEDGLAAGGHESWADVVGGRERGKWTG